MQTSSDVSIREDREQDFIPDYDEGFGRHLRGLTTGAYRTDNLELPPSVDEDTRLLTGSHNNNPSVTFAPQEFTKMELVLRRTLYHLSAISASAKGVIDSVKEGSDQLSQEIHSVMEWQRRQLVSLAEHQQYLLGVMAIS